MVAKPSHMHVGEGAESIHQPRPRAGPPPCCQAKLLNIVSTFRFRTNWLRFLYYLIMISLGSLVKSLTGTGIFLVISDILAHHLNVVLELGKDGDDGGALGHRALDKLRICSCCSLAASSLIRSILFWRMRMCFSRPGSPISGRKSVSTLLQVIYVSL